MGAAVQAVYDEGAVILMVLQTLRSAMTDFPRESSPQLPLSPLRQAGPILPPM